MTPGRPREAGASRDAALSVRVGVIGLGFMGRTHVRCYAQARAQGHACELVAVADHTEDHLSGRDARVGNIDTGGSDRLFDPALVRVSTSPSELLRSSDIDLVSICTPTPTHVELALEALRHGKHVLVEKPVALTSGDVRRLMEAAERAGRLCVPAMCMRFWPEWSWLCDRVASGSDELGPVRSASFERLGCRPTWASFYADPQRCGGALFDLHVHDVDFVLHCFGRPRSTLSVGNMDHVSTVFRFDRGGPDHVVAHGGWDQHGSFPFRMRYVVNFEHATADFDIARRDRLLLHRDGTSRPVPVEDTSGYAVEIRRMVQAVSLRLAGSADGIPPASLADALEVTRLLELAREQIGS